MPTPTHVKVDGTWTIDANWSETEASLRSSDGLSMKLWPMFKEDAYFNYTCKLYDARKQACLDKAKGDQEKETAKRSRPEPAQAVVDEQGEGLATPPPKQRQKVGAAAGLRQAVKPQGSGKA